MTILANESLDEYSNIKIYIATCYRNTVNSTDALILLMEDNPFTVEEIFSDKKDVESN